MTRRRASLGAATALAAAGLAAWLLTRGDGGVDVPAAADPRDEAPAFAPGATLTASARADAAADVPQAPDPAVLYGPNPPSTARLTWPAPQPGQTRADVTLLGPDGKPVAGVAVVVSTQREATRIAYVVTAGSRTGATYETRPWNDVVKAPGSRVTGGVTDAEGRVRLFLPTGFTVGYVQAGAPHGYLECFPATVADWTPAATVIRFERAYRIRGVVQDIDGKPLAGARVEGESEVVHSLGGTSISAWEHPVGTPTLEWTLLGETRDRSGLFDLGPYHADFALRIRALFPGCKKPGSATTVLGVRAGDEEVALVADRSGEIVVRVLDWTGSYAGEAMIAPVPRAGAPAGGAMKVAIPRDGAVHLADVEPDGEYDVWLTAGSESGRGLLLTGLRLGSSPLDVRLVPGREATVRVEGVPADAPRPAVSVRHGGIWIQAERGKGGTFRLVNVPPGEWTVEAHAFVESGPTVVPQAFRNFHASAPFAPEAEIVLRLEEQPRR